MVSSSGAMNKSADKKKSTTDQRSQEPELSREQSNTNDFGSE